jgi:hypothetical protein
MLWAAITAATFNLLCNMEVPDVHGDTTGAEIVFRVDLRSKRYCIDTCEEIFPILSFDRSRIVFENTRGIDATRQVRIVSRKNGAYFYRSSSGDRTMTTRGNCVSAKFSGIPAAKISDAAHDLKAGIQRRLMSAFHHL